MPKRGSFASGVADEARRRMGTAVSQAEFKRWQAVWLAAGEDLSNDEIARITGLAVRSVHARCRHNGVSSLADQPMGGRHRSNLTLDAERDLLAGFFARAARGQVLIVAEIQAAVSKLVGRPVRSAGIYKMLARHNWRKIAPRPKHPRGDAQARASFKKTPRTRLRPRRTR
jgi:Winged helix-turn helix